MEEIASKDIWKHLIHCDCGFHKYFKNYFLRLHIYSELGPMDGICVEVRGHIVGVSSLLPTGGFL